MYVRLHPISCLSSRWSLAMIYYVYIRRELSTRELTRRQNVLAENTVVILTVSTAQNFAPWERTGYLSLVEE